MLISFERAMSMVLGLFLSIAACGDANALTGSVNGANRSADEPRSTEPARRAAGEADPMAFQYTGVGVIPRSNWEQQGAIVVQAIIPGSAAAGAGIEPGWTIQAIQGYEIDGGSARLNDCYGELIAGAGAVVKLDLVDMSGHVVSEELVSETTLVESTVASFNASRGKVDLSTLSPVGKRAVELVFDRKTRAARQLAEESLRQHPAQSEGYLLRGLAVIAEIDL